MKRGSKADEILSLLFMLFAIAAGICYFAASDKKAFLIVGGIAVLMRIVQYVLRFF